DVMLYWWLVVCVCFFFQAEDGIRDRTVTGVQTCALPISSTNDIRFNKYQAAGSAWLSAEVAFLVDGQERWLEQYTEIKTDTPLADALFDPRQWKKARS